MADRIENEGFIALAENVRRLIALAKSQNQKIRLQEAEIKALNSNLAQLEADNKRLSEELAKVRTANSLRGGETSTDEAKAYIDEILGELKSGLALVESLNVVDYKIDK